MAIGLGNFSAWQKSLRQVVTQEGELFIKLASQTGDDSYRNVGYTREGLFSAEPNTQTDGYGEAMVISYRVKSNFQALQTTPVRLRELKTLANEAIDLKIVSNLSNGDQMTFELKDANLIFRPEVSFVNRGTDTRFEFSYEREFSAEEFEDLWQYYAPPEPPIIYSPEQGASDVALDSEVSILAETDATLEVEFSKYQSFQTIAWNKSVDTAAEGESVSEGELASDIYRSIKFSLSDAALVPGETYYMRARIKREEQTTDYVMVEFVTVLSPPVLNPIEDVYYGQSVLISWEHAAAAHASAFKIQVAANGVVKTVTHNGGFSVDLTQKFQDFVGRITDYEVKVAAVSASGEDKWSQKQAFSILAPEWDLEIDSSITLDEYQQIEIQHNDTVRIPLNEVRTPEDDTTGYDVEIYADNDDETTYKELAEVSPSYVQGDGLSLDVRYHTEVPNQSRYVKLRAQNTELSISHYKTIQFLVKRETVASVLGSALWADYDAKNASVSTDSKTVTIYGQSKTAYKMTSSGVSSLTSPEKSLFASIDTQQPYVVSLDSHKSIIFFDTNGQVLESAGNSVGGSHAGFLLGVVKGTAGMYCRIPKLFNISESEQRFRPDGDTYCRHQSGWTLGSYPCSNTSRLLELPFVFAFRAGSSQNLLIKEYYPSLHGNIYTENIATNYDSGGVVAYNRISGLRDSHFGLIRSVIVNGEITSEQMDDVIKIMWREAGL